MVAPQKAVLRDGMELRGELLQVGGVVPWLDVHENGRLGNDDLLLLLLVGISLLLGLKGSLLLLSLLAEQVHVVIVSGSSLRWGSGGSLWGSGSLRRDDLVALSLVVGSHAGNPLDDVDVVSEELGKRLRVLLARRKARDEWLARQASVDLLQRHLVEC